MSAQTEDQTECLETDNGDGSSVCVYITPITNDNGIVHKSALCSSHCSHITRKGGAAQMSELIGKAIEVVFRAGELFRRQPPGEAIVYEKGYANYVTEVDYAVQEFLGNELLDLLPGSNIIGEESEHNNYKAHGPTWVVDPVDGTTNFMYGYRHSAVSVALFIDGKPNMGLIYNPDAGELFTAQTGKGAQLNNKSIMVSGCAEMEKALIAFGTTPYDRSTTDKTFAITKDVYSNCRDIRRSGSAALDIAYVACGRLDGFYELNLQPWDYAAGIVILREAGGRICGWKGEALDMLQPGSVVGTNGLLHDKLSVLLNK